jgi:hypothetical protein
LAEHNDKQFADRAAWHAHLQRLGITTLAVLPDPVRIATEGALWSSVRAHGLLAQTVIVSDDAGQFNVARLGLRWVHAERLVHKLDAFTDRHHAAQQRIRSLIWWFYADLKAYRRDPTAKRKAALRARFDRLFRRQTGFATLDRLLARLNANKPELLRAKTASPAMVLGRPEIPLHTIGSESAAKSPSAKSAAARAISSLQAASWRCRRSSRFSSRASISSWTMAAAVVTPTDRPSWQAASANPSAI